jgi:hypothetical protein
MEDEIRNLLTTKFKKGGYIDFHGNKTQRRIHN